MLISKNIRKIHSTIDIKKILSRNNIVWGKTYLWKKYELEKYFKIKKLKQTRTQISKSSLMRYEELSFGWVNGERLYRIVGKLSSVWSFRGHLLHRGYSELEIIDVRENESSADYVIVDIYEAIQRNFKGKYLKDVKSTVKGEFPDNGEKDGYFYELIE